MPNNAAKPQDPGMKAETVADKVLGNLVANPDVNLTKASADRMKTEIVKETTAVIVNQTNQEPWYKSRVTWGAIIMVGASIAGIVGYQINAEAQQELLDSVMGITALATSVTGMIGGLITWYGRWIAKKPIGE